MAITTINFVGATPRKDLKAVGMDLPSKAEMEDMQSKGEASQSSLFWQCPKCGACVLFSIDECYRCGEDY